MWCAILGFLASPLLCQSLDLLPTARPAYVDLVQWYGPDPDCANAASHVRYLRSLKTMPTKDGDDPLEYDHAIDQYIERFRYYCQ